MLKNSLDSYVWSTRVRLARNLAGYNFIPTLRVRQAENLLREVGTALDLRGLEVTRLADLTDAQVSAYKERHLISEALIRNRNISAFASNREMSVMINEEDHLRIQCIVDGLEIEYAYDCASKLDDYLSNSLTYAYDERLGYLTACPTNLGTGLRAGVMMFLPGLNLTGAIGEMASGGGLSHMTFRGVYGEGSDAEGYLYQLSNRNTLGLSEQEILQEVKESIAFIAQSEERAREELFSRDRVALTDRIYRAWGMLTNSYIIEEKECLAHLAFAKLGVGLSLIKLKEPRALDRMMVECRKGSLSETETDEEEIAILRAQKLREVLSPLRMA